MFPSYHRMMVSILLAAVVLSFPLTAHATLEVLKVSPSSGPTTGGTKVTVSGEGFITGAKAYFDGKACSKVKVISAVALTCYTPKHSAATVEVKVANPNGKSKKLARAFTFKKPAPAPSPSPSPSPSPKPSPTPSASPIPGTGSVWYVRPATATSTYGREDGTSYENAFNGLTDMTKLGGARGITWGTGGVKAGDTLYICGNHYLKARNPKEAFYYGRIFIPINGTANAPITIRMDEPSHPGTLWGYGRNTSANDSWTGPDANGIYKINRDLGEHIAQDVQLETKGVVYTKQMTSTTWIGNPGAFYRTSGATYVKTTDGKSPAGRLYTGDIGYHFAIYKNQYLKFVNGKYYGANFEVDRDQDGEMLATLPRSSNITIQGNVIGYSPATLFQLIDGHNYWKFHDNTMMYAANAIYTYGYIGGQGGGTGASYMHVRGNTFKNLGILMYPHQDAHGVGVQRGKGHVIEYNYFEGTGSAIEFWTGNTSQMKDMIVRYNFINGPTARSTTEGNGITISGDSDDPLGARTGFKVYGNIVFNAEGNCFSSNNADYTEVYNNTFVGCGDSGLRFSNPNFAISAKVVNNIVVNPKIRYMDFHTNGTPNLTWDNNIYYSSSGSPKFNWYSTMGEWSQDTGGVDAHSQVVNPGFVSINPLQAGDVRLKAGSPAINAGANVDYPTDYSGTAVPQGSAPDIGAFEYQDR